MTVAQRSIRSARWNIVVSAIQVILGVARYILLARWLPEAAFGVYAYGTAIVGISIILTEWGMNEAYLHRSEETADEGKAIAVLFTLRIGFTLLWAIALVSSAWFFLAGADRLTVIVLTLAHAMNNPLLQTPTALLTRRIVHRRLALRQLVNTLVGSAVALWLAWQGAELWALLATDIVNAVVTIVLLYTWRPVWMPQFGWVPSIARYYLRFGARSFVATFLLRTADEIDDIWTRTTLGLEALGFYARAFQLAIYPRQILATPLSIVADGTYSELKGNRPALSKAFFRTNALIIRSGFLFAGMLALTAPEFIPLLLTDKWSPMIPTFQLMLIFALLDPLRATVANLFIAVGRPEQIIRARALQLVTLILGLYVLGPRWNIAGVAMAVNLMLVVGIGLLLWQAHEEVDFSTVRLFGLPLVALGLGFAAAWGAVQLAGPGAWWWTGGVKLFSFVGVYSGVVLSFEYQDILKMGRLILKKGNTS